MAIALLKAFEANGISVGAEAHLKAAGDFPTQHQDRLGVRVEVGEDAIHIKPVGAEYERPAVEYD